MTVGIMLHVGVWVWVTQRMVLEWGSDGSLSDSCDFADIHGVELGADNWAVLEWGGDVGVSAGGEDSAA